MSSRSSSEQFDGFYRSARRRLLLQSLALTGDLGAARAGVREAFTAAAHHWRKVSRLDRPEDWVRPRAWTAAQRRSRGHPFHRERDLDDDQQAVLAGLHRLPDLQRRALLLTHLAALSLAEIGREIGQPTERTSQLLQRATASLSLSLECDSALLRAEIEKLTPLVESPGLPRPTLLFRAGRRRRRRHVAGAAVLGVVLVVGAGFAVVDRSPSPAAEATVEARPVTEQMLLHPSAAATTVPHTRWRVTRTGHNTAGDGLNTRCQQARFADPHGVTALVRILRARERPARRLVQSVEVSDSPATARHTYATTLGWYAGCAAAQVHLVDAFRVNGAGDQARILRLRFTDGRPRSASVAIVRQGAVTQSLVLQVPGTSPPRAGSLLEALSRSTHRLCGSDPAGPCSPVPQRPVAHPALPPDSGEARGMLATEDLPAVGGLRHAWVGTKPARGGRNLAQTTCDRADFTAAGATMRTRSFLVPRADLPERFGITETYGRFGGTKRAAAFLGRLRHRMSTCEKRELGTKVHDHLERTDRTTGSTFSLWRVTSEISDHRSVSYWMGLTRVGRYVAQVSFAPAPHADIARASFTALVQRARDRLRELPGSRSDERTRGVAPS